jgi:hypothetical protein
MDRHTISDITIRNSRIIPVATPVILRQFKTLTLHLQKSVEVAPSVVAFFAFWETKVQRDGALVQDEVDVFCWVACILCESMGGVV